MGMFKISKHIGGFSTTHRVRTQNYIQFDIKFNGYLEQQHQDYKCKRLHGHNYELTLDISSNQLLQNENTVVFDYNILKSKTITDIIDLLDHRILLDIDDPLLHKFILKNISDDDNYNIIKNILDKELQNRKDMKIIKLNLNLELDDDLCFINDNICVSNFVITSENLAKYFNKLYKNVISEYIKRENIIENTLNELILELVTTISETPKTKASYSDMIISQ